MHKIHSVYTNKKQQKDNKFHSATLKKEYDEPEIMFLFKLN